MLIYDRTTTLFSLSFYSSLCFKTECYFDMQIILLWVNTTCMPNNLIEITLTPLIPITACKTGGHNNNNKKVFNLYQIDLKSTERFIQTPTAEVKLV